MGGAVPWQSSTYVLVNEVEESATVCRAPVCTQGSRFSVFSFYGARPLRGIRPHNDDVMPMRLAHTMVIDRIQLAVYCLSNCFAGKSLTCFAPRSYRYKHPQ